MNLVLRVKYIHSELDALQRVRVLCALRKGEFDALIGINLLREGIDLPEVSLVAILDADKEGFLRSSRALIQVSGRAARHKSGRVILYADKITDSIKELCRVSKKRREEQEAHNKKYDITPTTIVKEIKDYVGEIAGTATDNALHESDSLPEDLSELIPELEKEMIKAAASLEFERAADLRDMIKELEIADR